MSTPRTFAVSWDYRCPFARNAHEHVVAALEAGAPWSVTWVPFSLNQAHVEDGGTDVWDDPGEAANLLAVQAGIVVRDRFPEQFPKAHLALFAGRHDEGRDLRRPEVVRAVLEENDVDGGAVLEAIEEGWPLETFRKEHEASVNEHQAFGVPTFFAGGRAAFVRVMSRPRGDAELATSTIERVLGLVEGWADLNEFKATTIPR